MTTFKNLNIHGPLIATPSVFVFKLDVMGNIIGVLKSTGELTPPIMDTADNFGLAVNTNEYSFNVTPGVGKTLSITGVIGPATYNYSTQGEVWSVPTIAAVTLKSDSKSSLSYNTIYACKSYYIDLVDTVSGDILMFAPIDMTKLYFWDDGGNVISSIVSPNKAWTSVGILGFIEPKGRGLGNIPGWMVDGTDIGYFTLEKQAERGYWYAYPINSVNQACSNGFYSDLCIANSDGTECVIDYDVTLKEQGLTPYTCSPVDTSEGTPFYQLWYFWVIVGVLILALIITMILLFGNGKKTAPPVGYSAPVNVQGISLSANDYYNPTKAQLRAAELAIRGY